MSREIRVKTGVPGLDELLGGGVLGGSTTLLIGPVGSLKSYLGQQFIREGLRKGERCAYINTVQSLSKLSYQMKATLKFDPKPYVEEGRLILSDIHKLFVEKALRKMEIRDLERIEGKIAKMFKMVRGGRGLLHSLTPFFYMLEDEKAVPRFVQVLKTIAGAYGVTLLITLDEGAQNKYLEEGIKSFCDYVLATNVSEGGMRGLRVMKSLTKHDLEWHEISFVENGVRIQVG